MKWPSILAGVSIICALASPIVVNAAPLTYVYAITHARYGAIGTYVHTIDSGDGVTHAQSRLNVAVKILGLVVYRQSADQTEVWRGQRLNSFQSETITNGRRLNVSGEASGSRFLVTSPSGIAVAPAGVVASDPWSLNRMGSGVVVSIRTGKIEKIEVTGGETDIVTTKGISVTARHFHVNSATQPNKWEVWLDPQGVPIKFRSLESNGAIDFSLVSTTPQTVGVQPLAAGARQQ